MPNRKYSMKLTITIIGISKMIKVALPNVRSIGIAIGIVCIFFSCAKKEKINDAVENGTPVKIGYPSSSSMIESMDFNATTVYLKKEIVRSTFQGFVQKAYKNIGDHILQGEVIFQLITKEASAADSLQLTFRGTIDVRAKSSGVLTEMNFNAGDFISEG